MRWLVTSHLISICTVCHSFFFLNWLFLFATMGMSKSIDGRVHIRNSGVKGLNLLVRTYRINPKHSYILDKNYRIFDWDKILHRPSQPIRVMSSRPYQTCPELWNKSILMPVDVTENCWVSNLQCRYDQTPCSATSNIGLHNFTKRVCLKT